jgi:hypothetical protein
MLPCAQFPARRVSASQRFLDVSSHRCGAFEIFPGAAFPKIAAARIIHRHQNIGALEAGAFQTRQALVD